MLRSMMLADKWLRCWLRYGGLRLLEGWGLTATLCRLVTSLRSPGCLVASILAWILACLLPSIRLVALTMRIARWLRSLIAWIVGFGVNQDADAPFDDARCLIDGFDPGGFDCSKRLGSYRSSSSLDYFASVAWVILAMMLASMLVSILELASILGRSDRWIFGP
jgi:hypothetical protein